MSKGRLETSFATLPVAVYGVLQITPAFAFLLLALAAGSDSVRPPTSATS